jgi:hypothetical protein
VDYRNVKVSPGDLETMLSHSGGAREVPVILHQGGKVEIGWMGKT